MGYVLRLRLASFFMGAGAASFLGLYIIHRDYRVAQKAIAEQIEGISNSLDRRILALEKFKENEISEPVGTTE
ncbi:hypothetical protein I3843_06G037100 [Carya illinoinensis]|uniref:Uncharacterized protein n=1 Tax=Carya illinoinensis TaxID=32201 RepID=A0A8T1Q7Q8_CARIL|nr:hypothetical protein I3760_06G040800 [Carya illinoinensis]KAG6650422.1 hypothetical protein CIPAW_06G042200 [Carya illinoinensis]KAG6707620.1 hypothetical protein I3842_06G041500 [Carya illinoinensis]KAG7974210.1 hypothetical protein I3843_06G037100 [Carya illinoinensis]